MNEATRCVEVSKEEYGYDVRITALATFADYSLFRDTVDVMRQQLKATALFENDEESPIENVYEFLNDDWIREHMDSDIRVLTSLVFHEQDFDENPNPDGNEIEIQGPFRSFFLGKRLFEFLNIKAFENDKEAAQHLYDRMLYVQWGLPQDLRETRNGKMDIDQTHNEEDYKTITMYFYGESDFISGAEYIIIRKEDFCEGGKELLVIKYEHLLDIGPDEWELVDNKQLWVHETPKEVFAEFWKKALPLATLNV